MAPKGHAKSSCALKKYAMWKVCLKSVRIWEKMIIRKVEIHTTIVHIGVQTEGTSLKCAPLKKYLNVWRKVLENKFAKKNQNRDQGVNNQK